MVMDAVGHFGAGTSLDNTIRVGSAASGEWVLVDGLPEQSVGGYGHGTVRLWAEDGTLVGIASQTATLWRQEPDQHRGGSR
jgi:acyl-CoA thioesterase